MNYLNLQRIGLLLTIAVWCTMAHSQSDAYRPPYKWVCQWSEGNAYDEGCTGMIGLMRLSRTIFTAQPNNRKRASKILFAHEELPALGSEVVILRSAHLRGYYWPDRDDQSLSNIDKICNRVGCVNTTRPWGSCAFKIRENSKASREDARRQR